MELNGKQSIVFTILTFLVGVPVMLLISTVTSIPLIVNIWLSIFLAIVFWLIFYVSFSRFEFVRLLLKDFDPQQQDDEEEEPEESVDPRYFVGGYKRPDERPQSQPPEPKGITKDSEDPRKYLR